MRCPGCHREAEWQDNRWRPFCSERCQLVDFGRWVSGDYRVPLFEEPDSLDGLELDRDLEPDLEPDAEPDAEIDEQR